MLFFHKTPYNKEHKQQQFTQIGWEESTMKRMTAMSLAMAMTLGLAGCGNSEQASGGADGQPEVLEFYHGFYHEESEWPAAKVMRDIYDEFAKSHADGSVTFKPIPVENRDDVVNAQIAGGKFPDMIDMYSPAPKSAISQGLLLDMKPFIDENNLQDAVGINYTQNQIDGKIYNIHEQVEARGMWANTKILDSVGASIEDLSTWQGFADTMAKVSALGNGTYGYAAGQGSLKMMYAYLASTEEGRAITSVPLTEAAINSEEFAAAFKTLAKMDQVNGAEYTTPDVGNLMADFNQNGKAAVISNGAWNASGISPELADVIEPIIFPENVSLSTAGNGLAIASGMSEAKTEMALEFIKYVTSPEIQERIFLEVQGVPSNTTLDLKALAEKNGDPVIIKMAEACAMIQDADIVVSDPSYKWGMDVGNAITNALMECANQSTDIEARFAQLQKELIALIG